MDWKGHYTRLAEFLGNALGTDYEVVLHDLTGGRHTILHIVNSHVSGRGPEAPLSELAMEFVRQKKYETHEYMLNYAGVSAEGHALRSSTLFIKDEDGDLLGMLCINFNQHKYSSFAQGVLDFVAQNYGVETAPASEVMSLDLVEHFHESVTQRFKTIVAGMFGEGYAAEKLTQSQKIEILRRLEASGVFRVKGAVSEVAGLLCTSAPSVYRYLAAIRKNSEKA